MCTIRFLHHIPSTVPVSASNLACVAGAEERVGEIGKKKGRVEEKERQQ